MFNFLIVQIHGFNSRCQTFEELINQIKSNFMWHLEEEPHLNLEHSASNINCEGEGVIHYYQSLVGACVS